MANTHIPRVAPPGELVLDSDRESNYQTFASRWDSYYVLSRLKDEEEEYQRALLLYTMGADAAKVVSSSEKFKDAKTCKLILEILQQYCVGEKNVIQERYTFNTRAQLPGESFDAFYAELRSLAKKCSFDYRPAEGSTVLPSDEMLRDRIVLGVRDDRLRKKLITQGSTLTLGAAVRTCRSEEGATSALKSMSSTDATSIGAVHKKFTPKPRGRGNKYVRPTTQSTATPDLKSKCTRCGKGPHQFADCPAKSAECRKCKKVGHYAAHCKTKVKSMNEVKQEGSDDTLFTGELVIGQVAGWNATVKVNGLDAVFKLDTGADGTVIAENEPWIQGMELAKADTTLTGPGGKTLDILGVFQARMQYKNRSHTEKAYVIKGQSTSLLSRDACSALGLVTCHVGEVTAEVKEKYPQLFGRLGLLKGYRYHISLREDAQPKCIYSPRSVSLPLRELVKAELESMVKKGVISPVTETTEWCSGLVTVEKPNGAGVRLCVDLTGLNAAVKREIHPMSTVEQSLAQLGNSKVFSKLDANSGFWQVELSKESRLLTTFLTPFGRYCFNRVPFGISSAPEIFQRAMSEVLAGVEGAICHMDDILIHGSDRKNHDATLHEVLKRLQGAGLSLNAEKCQFHQSKLKFLGHIIDADGVKPDPAKLHAMANFPTPTCKSELRRLNGMLNQLARFIPHLATLNAPMRELLKECNEWTWGKPQEDAFRKIKAVLTSTETMAHYDHRLETIITTDASGIGLGATLSQVQKDGTRRPVAYASRSVTDVEKNYAAIEKEALAASWACDKFDQYVRGKQFTLETDHRPLVPLLTTKDLDKVPVRILRMRLRLMRYAPVVTYIKGSLNNLADALSRAPIDSPTYDDICFINEVETAATRIISKDPVIARIMDEQSQDEVCKQVLRYCREGWPTYKTDANRAIHAYFDAQAHLNVVNGLLLYDDRVVIPSSLRLEILDRVHQAHQGIEKCRARARKSVWWPLMSSQIKEMVSACMTCRKLSPTPVEPLCPSTLPDRPWSRLGADLFELEKSTYLLIVDYYSRWIEVRRLSSLGTKTTIEAMKSMLTTHGVPDQIISDNGPQFASKEFMEFAQEYGFTHITSSPRYPKANGEAERAVGTVKSLWKKSEDYHLSLLIYRSTPLSNGYTPSELLMGRLLQTTLPIMPDKLTQHTVPREEILRPEERTRDLTKANYDRRHAAQHLPELKSGSSVYIRDLNREGVITREVSPRSYLVNTPQGTIRRNRSALISHEQRANRQLVAADDAEVQGHTSQANKASRGSLPGSGTNGAEGPAHTSGAHASQLPESRVEGTDGAEGPAHPTGAHASQLPSTTGSSRPQRARKKPSYLEKNYVLD